MPPKRNRCLTVRKGKDCTGRKAIKTDATLHNQSQATITLNDETHKENVDATLEPVLIDSEQGVKEQGKPSSQLKKDNTKRHVPDDDSKPGCSHWKEGDQMGESTIDVEVEIVGPSAKVNVPASELDRLPEDIDDVLADFLNDLNEEVQQQRDREAAENAAVRVQILNIARNVIMECETYLHAARWQNAIESDIGEMNLVCIHCGALFFSCEKNTQGRYTNCCKDGRVRLQPIPEPPAVLRNLFNGADLDHEHFMKNVLKYNYAFQFASIEANRVGVPGRGPYVYKIQGKIMHHIKDVVPNEPNPRYGPLYFLDPEEALNRREMLHQRDDLLRRILSDIQHALYEVNPFARGYMHLREVYDRQILQREQQYADRFRAAEQQGLPPPFFEMNPIPNLVLDLGTEIGRQRRARQHDLPQVNEVAVVYREDQIMEGTLNQRVFLRPNGGAVLREINVISPLCDPLTFPLLLPRGTEGWNPNIGFVAPAHRQYGANPRSRIAMNDFYRYRFAYRQGFQILQLAGRLTQQYLVNAYVKNETNTLNYIATHQNDIRAENYAGLADYVESNAETQNARVGKIVILPSTYVNSKRAITQNYQDSMAIVRHLGPPSFFVTFTCNPNWREIRDAVGVGNQTNDHPMLVARVFNAKLKALLEDITKRQVFGITDAYVHVIEFQKRGLPHAHILIIARRQDKLQTPEQVDRFISAEIPDPEVDPVLYEKVRRHMVHRPCGANNPNAPCTSNTGRCSKKFPQSYHNETTIHPTTGVTYMRRNQGRSFPLRLPTGDEFDITNEWIVSYNPYLLIKYNAHINVIGFCNLQVVKYLFKYLNKGYDRALVQVVRDQNENLENNELERQIEYDEIQSYQSYRYVTPSECSWRLNQYPLRNNSHTVYRMRFHLFQQQQVYFNPMEPQRALDNNERTMFTEWFTLNQTDEAARRYLYCQIPYFYTFNKSQKRWNRRKRRIYDLITRLYQVSIRNRETYMLRLLLLHVRGAKSYEELRSYDGTPYASFEAACRARNLLADDGEWERCMEEAAFAQMAPQLRSLFAYILAFCDVQHPLRLWEKFSRSLAEDYLRRGVNNDEAIQRTLQVIQQILIVNGTRLANFGLPEPPAEMDVFDPQLERADADRLRDSLNEEQKNVYEQVLRAVMNDNDNGENKLFVVQGAGGTGKTFLYNALIATLRSERIDAVAMAWTGLAATNLIGGRTVHSQMKFPVPWNGTSNLTPNSEHGRKIRAAKLIVWDEISMGTKDAFNLMNSTLQDVCENVLPFGGKVVLLGGDFKQCLPFTTGLNTRADILDQCVKSSNLWPRFSLTELRINERLLPDQTEFSEYLDQLGNGRLRADVEHPLLLANAIDIPARLLVGDLNSLIESCFGNDRINSYNSAILCPLNKDCHTINDTVLERLIAPSRTYHSADSVEVNEIGGVEDEQRVRDFSIEYANSLTPSGMPLHELKMKRGAVVMLLRNLNLRDKLCNGTRLVVKSLPTNYLECERLDHNGRVTGEIVFIPRVQLIYKNESLPFTLKRRQFPVRLAYAMTINKSQGLTMKKVGVYLPQPVFAHGQLYVALSRCKTADDVRIFVETTQCHGQIVPNDPTVYTNNIVYREVL